MTSLRSIKNTMATFSLTALMASCASPYSQQDASSQQINFKTEDNPSGQVYDTKNHWTYDDGKNTHVMTADEGHRLLHNVTSIDTLDMK